MKRKNLGLALASMSITFATPISAHALPPVAQAHCSNQVSVDEASLPGVAMQICFESKTVNGAQYLRGVGKLSNSSSEAKTVGAIRVINSYPIHSWRECSGKTISPGEKYECAGSWDLKGAILNQRDLVVNYENIDPYGKDWNEVSVNW